ncbi:PDZ/DHR/GLGF domain protein [Necator americanus]|uniref:PDZ/DHR/GLGF domain protein n=1 Tax=Necator americanus TaxID=51031 RepID=W2TJR1_NECAM|nr:PDZ/DHR/GLGF domain protein [Necator americanus]ETN81411.1 PDZ/DHR/GLGF domain protein [Necator americanus]
MRVIEVSRKDGQSLGISIHGGVGKPAANPADERDEGIFIEKVEPSSVCHRAGLQVGHRLIEVNGDSLLGCDQSEAAAILRASNELRILVCDGYNKPTVPRIDDRTITSSQSSSSNVLVDENKLVSTSSISTVANTSIQNGEHHLEASRFDDPPLASSSPLPSTPLTSAPASLQNVPIVGDLTQPEKLTFASKVKNFEREIEVQRLATKHTSASSLPSPAMKPLITDNDVLKMKEEEGRRRGTANREAVSPLESGAGFEKMLDDCVKSNIGSNLRKIDNSSPSSHLINSDTPLNEVERRAMEQQRRSEWRAARLRSLDQERAEADAIMDRLQLISLPAIGEDVCVPPSERILSNDISVERSMVVDAVTGERTVTVVEKSVTKREIDVALAGGEIDYADK